MKSIRLGVILWMSLCLLTVGCKQNSSAEERDTPTSGHITIAVDEAFKNLTDGILATFHSNYPDAKITVKYYPENNLFSLLQKDSVRLIMMGRSLRESEFKFFDDIKIQAKVTRIAVDGIAVIAHPDNDLKQLTMQQLKDLLAGNMTLFPNGQKIQVILDHPGSGIWSYLKDSVLIGAEPSKQIYALNSMDEVIDYVSKNKNAIGFIDVNHISKFDDEQNQSFGQLVKPIALSKKENDEAFEPYQAYIATRQYPLIRPVNIVIREPYNGLGSGLGAFIASNKGQLMVLNEGLVPSTQPIRLVEIKTDPLGQ